MGALAFTVALRMITGSAKSRDAETLIKPIKNLCGKFLTKVRQNGGRHRGPDYYVLVEGVTHCFRSLVTLRNKP